MLQTALISTSLPGGTATKDRAAARRARRLRASSSDAYSKDIALFLRFGGTIPCDGAAVLRYLDVLRPRVAAITAYRRVMAIQRTHVNEGHPTPTDDPAVRQALRWLQAGRFPPKPGGKATKTEPTPAKREPRSAKPLTRALLERCLDAMGRNMLDRRDRAMLLLGFMAGLKRHALVSLNAGDVAFTTDAALIRVRGDSESSTRTLAVAFTSGDLCAATALRDLIFHLAMEPQAPLFTSFNRAGEPTSKRLSAAFVSCVVKRRLQIVGIDPKPFSAESLRRGRVLEVSKGVL